MGPVSCIEQCIGYFQAFTSSCQSFWGFAPVPHHVGEGGTPPENTQPPIDSS